MINLTLSDFYKKILFPLFNSKTESDVDDILQNNNPAEVFEAATHLVEHTTIQCLDGNHEFSAFFRLPHRKRIWLLNCGWKLESLIADTDGFNIVRQPYSQNYQTREINIVNSCYFLYQSATLTTIHGLKSLVYNIAYQGRYSSSSIQDFLQVAIEPIYIKKQWLKDITSKLKLTLLVMQRLEENKTVFLPLEIRYIILEKICNQYHYRGKKLTLAQIKDKQFHLLQTPLASLQSIKTAETLEEHKDALVSTIAPSLEEFRSMRY